MDVHFFNDLPLAIKRLRQDYKVLLGAYMDDRAQSLYQLDMSGPCALIFGNERDGITPELKSELDGLFFIPQFGLVQSLNISVACAVTIYEGIRQRAEFGKYNTENTTEGMELWAEYQRRHAEKHDGGEIISHTSE